MPLNVRRLSRQRCSRVGTGGFGVLPPARHTRVCLRGEVLPNPRTFRRSPLRCGRERRRGCHPNEFAAVPPSTRVRPRSPRCRSRRLPSDPRRDAASRNTAPCLACVSQRQADEPRQRVSLRQPLAPSPAREHQFCGALRRSAGRARRVGATGTQAGRKAIVA